MLMISGPHNRGMRKGHPSHSTLAGLLEASSREAEGRPWAYLSQRSSGKFNERVTQNWKTRGVPKSIEVLKELSLFTGIPFEAISRIADDTLVDVFDLDQHPASTGQDTGVNTHTPPANGGQIWSLPVIKGGALKLLQVKNSELEQMGVPFAQFRCAEPIDPSDDKAVELEIPVAGLEVGDVLIMRKLTKPVPFRYLAVIVEAPGGELFMMEHDSARIAQSGLKVRAYAVDRIAKRPPYQGMLIPQEEA